LHVLTPKLNSDRDHPQPLMGAMVTIIFIFSALQVYKLCSVSGLLY